jgi:hypothetical protein
MGTHDAMTRVEDQAVRTDADGNHESLEPAEFEGDARWPVTCACGYVFTASDVYQVFQNTLYLRSDTGSEIPLRDAPPGAMWDASWMSVLGRGADGRCLVVKCPNGREWVIDGQSSNCTMPDDHSQQKHHCWTRTGTPPVITVGKSYGPTCAAGGGSIQAGDYHGFLVNGVFQP